MKIKLDVVETVMIHHSVIIEADDEEESDMLINCDYDECTTLDDVIEEIESCDYKVLNVEREVLTDPDSFEVYSDGEVE